jgi:hypothetical protein
MKVSSTIQFVKDFLYEFEHSIVGDLEKAVRSCDSIYTLEALQKDVQAQENNIVIDIIAHHHASLTGPRRVFEAMVHVMHDIEEVFCVKTILVPFKYESNI